jgi:hypothetical protein
MQKYLNGQPLQFNKVGKSFTKGTTSKNPRFEPWGTPEVATNESDLKLL